MPAEVWSLRHVLSLICCDVPASLQGRNYSWPSVFVRLCACSLCMFDFVPFAFSPLLPTPNVLARRCRALLWCAEALKALLSLLSSSVRLCAASVCVCGLDVDNVCGLFPFSRPGVNNYIFWYVQNTCINFFCACQVFVPCNAQSSKIKRQSIHPLILSPLP